MQSKKKEGEKNNVGQPKYWRTYGDASLACVGIQTAGGSFVLAEGHISKIK